MVKRRTPSSSASLILIVTLLAQSGLGAAEHTGQVVATGVPVPGATVTATQGDKKVVTSTDQQGAYKLPDLTDGVWSMRVEMPGFASSSREVTVGPDAAATTWELALMSFADITRDLPPAPPEPPSPPPAAVAGDRSSPGQARPAATTRPGAASRTPPAPTSTFQRAAVNTASAPAPAVATADPPPADSPFGATDGFLVNGSVNNGAATPFAQAAAFGNNRRAVRSPYRYQIGLSARSSAWDASPSTFGARLLQQPDYNNLNVSGTFGGPFRIPKLIRNGPTFTVSYSRSTDQAATTSSALMPTNLERAGDFSQTRAFGQPVTIRDPLTGQPFANGVIPADRISPQAAALLAYYPLANLDGSSQFNYQRAIPTTTVNDSVSAQSSYALNNRNQVSGTVQYQHSQSDSTSLFGFADRTRGSGVTVSGQYNRRFSPLLSLRLRHAFSRQASTTTPFFANRINVSGDAGIAGNDQEPINWGPPAINLTSVSSLSARQYSLSRTYTNTTTPEVFWSRGRHSFTIGAEMRVTQLDLVSQQDPRGSFFFGGGVTGSDWADFLLGIPTTSRIAYGNPDKDLRGNSYAAYISDDLRVSPSLTMNVGVRWEYEAPYTEAQGRLVNLDVAPDFSAVAPVVASDPVGSLTGKSFSTSLVRPDKRGVQPRVAVAWRPILGSSVIVRAGYGIYRNNGLYQSLARALSQQPPLSYVVSAENSAITPLTLANGFIPSPGITQNTYAIDPDFRVSYAHVWQTSIQRDLPYSLTANVTYIGNRGVNMVQQFLPNTYAPGSANPCPSCPIGFAYVTSGGTLFRNSGAFQLRRRLRAGLTATGTYTLSKGTDNSATFSGTSGTSAQDWRNLEGERGPSNDDQRHLLNLEVQYTTGVGTIGGGTLQGFAGKLVRGWTMAGNMTVGSGRPFTPVYSTALPGSAINGTVRASLTGVPTDDVPAGFYLNPLAYGRPAAGDWGTAGRNSLRGPKQFQLNARLTRSFPLTNRFNADLQIQATNLLNRVTYSSFSTIVNSPQFGLPISANDMRKIQTSVRISF